jgi:hypothetical protein
MFTNDICWLGEPKDPHNRIRVHNFNFGLVLKQKTIFQGGFDAIIGLAYKKMAQAGEEPFFDQLMKSKLIKHDQFAFFLSFNPRIEASEITFGFYDPKRYVHRDLHWHKVINKVFYAIELNDLRIGN